MELLLITAGLALLGVAAARFGQDSRELESGAPWHTWRDALALSGPVGVDPAAVLRVEEMRATGARERMLRPRRRTAFARPGAWARIAPRRPGSARRLSASGSGSARLARSSESNSRGGTGDGSPRRREARPRHAAPSPGSGARPELAWSSAVRRPSRGLVRWAR